MLESILVPLDGSEISEQILPSIGVLAKALHAPVTLAHVVDTVALPSDLLTEHRAYLDQMVETEIAKARTYLAALQPRLAAENVTVSYAVLPGSPAETIVSYAHSQGMGLIAMSTHGRSGLGRWIMGSVADKVLHTATIPLLLFRPKEGKPPASVRFQNVILPLDGSPNAEQALPLAETLVRALDSMLLLARVVPIYSFAFSEPYPFGGAEMSVELWEAVEKDATDYLGNILAEAQSKGLKAESRLLRGDPGNQIIELAGKAADGIVVMSTHGRSGLGRWFLGSVADKVVRGSGSPVLLVRTPQ